MYMNTQRKLENSNPLTLSQTAIKDFQQAYFTEFGINISQEEANSKGSALLRLFKQIYKPIPKSVAKDKRHGK